MLVWMQLIKNNLACAFLCSKPWSEVHGVPERYHCSHVRSRWSNSVDRPVILRAFIVWALDSQSWKFWSPSVKHFILPITVVTHMNTNEIIFVSWVLSIETGKGKHFILLYSWYNFVSLTSDKSAARLPLFWLDMRTSFEFSVSVV